MSGDGPTKLAPPAAEPLDEIILGEDESAPAPPPPVVAAAPKLASVRPPAPAMPSLEDAARAAAEAKEKERKKQKLTLRIPDDEVSRPTNALPSSKETPSARAARPQSIPDDGGAALSPDATLEMPARPMPGVDTSNERGWTPYQPPVAEAAADNGGGQPIPAAAKTIIEESEPPPPSEDIPIDTDITGEHDALSPEAAQALVGEIDHDAETNPRLPLVLDSEEIKLDDGEGRVTDPGEAPEVDPEDLVSVESLPRPPPGDKAAVVTAPKVVSAPAPAASAPAAASGPVAPAATHVPAPSPSAPSPQATPQPAAAAPVPPVSKATQPQLQRPHTQPQAIQIHPVPTSPAAPTNQASQAVQAHPIVMVAPVAALAPPPMNEQAVANKKKVRPWWEELFNDDYIRTMAKISDEQIGAEATFIEDSLGCERGAMILDLACGTGRHAVELAKRGYQVVGYDLSLSMLARASDEAQERGQKINFVQGDMREMTFEETFDGIYTWNTSFGFFDEEKNGGVVAKVHRALKKGGQFLLDVVNRDYIVRQAPSLAWFEGDGCICMDEMQIDFITSRMKVKRTLMMDDGRTKEIEYSIRIYSLHELGKLLHDNGFRVAEVSGRTGTPGVFFGCESPRTLILAEKR